VKYPHLFKDLQGLASLRKMIIKQREWELKHANAITTKKEERIGRDIKKKFDKFLTNLGEDQRNKMLLATKRFLELMEQKAIVMEIDPD
jgi:GTP cyclohydrolase I